MPSPPPTPRAAEPAIAVGQLWTVDASRLDPSRIGGEHGRARLSDLFDALVEELDLHPVAPATWHVFPPPHEGVTGLVALSESHLSCHSFPESAGVTIDLYTCRSRPAPDWERIIADHLGAGERPVVHVRSIARSFAGPPVADPPGPEER